MFVCNSEKPNLEDVDPYVIQDILRVIDQNPDTMFYLDKKFLYDQIMDDFHPVIWSMLSKYIEDYEFDDKGMSIIHPGVPCHGHKFRLTDAGKAFLAKPLPPR